MIVPVPMATDMAAGTPTKVLLVMDTHTGQFGGTEQNTLRFAQALKRRGYHPVVAEVGKPVASGAAEAIGLSFAHIATDYFGDVSWGAWEELFDSLGRAIVVRSKCWVGSVNWRLDFTVRRRGLRYLGWEQHPAVEPVHAQRVGFRPLKRAVRVWLHARAVRRTVTISNAVRDPLVRYYPVPPSTVDLIYPGVDFAEFTRQHGAREALREEWQIPLDAVVVGSVGRLVPHKGNDFMLQVVAEMRRRAPTLHVWCVIAGRGPDLERLQGLATSLGIEDRVRFPGWQLSAPRTWSAMDLFVMPSSDEGLGLTLLESIGCGCLALAASVGGMPEILTGPLEEYCLPADDVDAWTTMALRLAQMTQAERAQRQEAALAYVRSRFEGAVQWDLMVDWLEKHSARSKGA